MPTRSAKDRQPPDAARADRAGVSGRRRTRRLSGRRLSGPLRRRRRAGLGHRHLDRRHQRRPHRRQFRPDALEPAARVLGSARPTGRPLRRSCGRRRSSAAPSPIWHRGAGRARLFPAQPAGALGHPHAGRHRARRLLFDRAAAQAHARRARRSRASEQQRDHRLTVGAVNVRTGEMCYFDSRDMALGPDHAMASGALPPAFPAVRIDDDHYWDGGPLFQHADRGGARRQAAAQLADLFGQYVAAARLGARAIWQVLGRQKDIQYASRGKSHVARQEQIHRLRHVIRELGMRLPADPAHRSRSAAS